MHTLIGMYKLKPESEDFRFRCGVTSFSLCSGSEVSVDQVDKEFRKVLINFGSGLVDWHTDNILKHFDKVV